MRKFLKKSALQDILPLFSTLLFGSRFSILQTQEESEMKEMF
jgi:hypothetical protein